MIKPQSLLLSDFHYELPPAQIAQEPLANRDQSNLLVWDGQTGASSHRRFFELDQILRPNDLVIRNTTRVFPARIRGKKPTGGQVELLLLEARAGHVGVWRSLVRGVTRPSALEFAEGLTATMEERLENGEWWIRFSTADLRPYLEKHGEMPLPPYIKRAEPREADRDRYQTVFAAEEGAVAAPTAGFHFTPALLDRLKVKGVEMRDIVLHVGWGTFRPIRQEAVEEHQMLAERFYIPTQTAEAIRKARSEKRRIVAVGTTVVRTLESAFTEVGEAQRLDGATDLFIYTGYRFKVIDALITNFHLPDSTPILLASAFAAFKQGTSVPFPLRQAYEEAIQKGYRFYSYGDAMLIQ